MIVKKLTFTLGVVIFLLPFVGIPAGWRTAIFVACGVILALSSIDISFSKKVNRHKPRKVVPAEMSEEVVESIPVYPKDNIVEEIKVVHEEAPIKKTVKKRSPRKTKVV